TKPIVGDECHDVALALDRPELERERCEQSLQGRDPLRARQLGALDQRPGIEANEIGNEQEQAPNAGRKLAWGKRKLAHVGDSLDGWADACGPLVIATAREAGESLCCQHLADGGGTQRRSPRLEFLADFVDRVVALAELHDLLDRPAFLWLGGGAWGSDCQGIGLVCGTRRM